MRWFDEKKYRTKGVASEGSSTDVGMVYALPCSFQKELEKAEELPQYEEGLDVAQLQLEDVKAVDAVMFEKPLALQTSFVRPLYIKALIEGRPWPNSSSRISRRLMQ